LIGRGPLCFRQSVVRLERIVDDDDVAASTGQRAADRGRQTEPARGKLDLGFRVLEWPDPRIGERRSKPARRFGANSAAGVRVSAETTMQHTKVMACVTVISEPLGKLTIILRKPNAWQTRLEFSSGRNASKSTVAWNASSWSPRSVNRFNRSSTSKNPACLRIESSPIHPSQWYQKAANWRGS
jgi:hypothetical protein